MPRKRRKESVRDADDVIRTYIEGDDRPSSRNSLEDTSRTSDAPHRGETARDADVSGGDPDASLSQPDAGEEVVGGDNPTPDQDIVENLGKSAGVTYEDQQPLEFGEKLERRDLNRWELNPASSEDYQVRQQRPRQPGAQPRRHR
jgi:uncharacterized protein DUF6335